MAAISGKTYLDRIDQMKSDVRINGDRVRGNIFRHPSFQRVMMPQAKHMTIKSKTMTL